MPAQHDLCIHCPTKFYIIGCISILMHGGIHTIRCSEKVSARANSAGVQITKSIISFCPSRRQCIIPASISENKLYVENIVNKIARYSLFQNCGTSSELSNCKMNTFAFIRLTTKFIVVFLYSYHVVD